VGLVIDRVTGDPASCSQLGGALRSQAARLLTDRAGVDAALTTLTRDPAQIGQADRTQRDVRLLDTIAEQLDAAGAVLQQYAQELATVSEGTRQLEAAVARAGLELDGLRVVEPWGVAPAETAARRRTALPELQMRSERLASQLGRARAAVQRSLVRSTELLARAAATSRGSLGG
jgi:hypothetical protein